MADSHTEHTCAEAGALHMPGTAERIKVSVNLTPEEVETLKRIAERRGISMTEVIRRALAMEKFIDESSAAGEKILVQSSDKSMRQLLIR